MPLFKMQFRRDGRAEWAAANPLLAPGEMGIEVLGVDSGGNLIFDTDPETGEAIISFKIGDGLTTWNDLLSAAGAKGAKGDPGAKGEKGDTGDTGPQGPIGPVGATGAAGPKGDAGSAGPVGSQGPTGPQGPKGNAGPVGPQGPKGDTGATGPQGPKGDQGAAGSDATVPAASPTVAGRVKLATAGDTAATPASVAAQIKAAQHVITSVTLSTALAAGASYTVPSFAVGSGKLKIFLDGLYCRAGSNNSFQYKEVGSTGAASTTIQFYDALPVGTEVTAVSEA